MSPITWAHRHRRAMLFTLAVIVLAGVQAAFRLPISLFPKITFPRIVILADDGEEPIESMMIQVTRPLEEAARGVPGVRTVRSKTSRGATEISVDLAWGTDVYRALQLLQGAIAAARNEIPPTASVQAERMDVSVFPVLGYTLTSKQRTQVELRDLALYTLRPATLRVGGVAQIQVAGGRTREFEVEVDPMALAAYGLGIGDVSDAIDATNTLGATGYLSENYHLYLGLTDNRFAGLEDIENAVVAVRSGAPVHVRDVAQVLPGEQEIYTRVTSWGQDAVVLDVMSQPGGNIVQIGRDIHTLLASMSNQLPPDVRIAPYMDQSEFISDSITGTRDAILIGIGLAMLVLLLFLRNIRVTLVAVLIVPATIAATLLCLHAVGLTINIMTLGGIAAAIGLVIDDVIVVVENIFHHFRPDRDNVLDSARSSIHELFPAIVGSSLATLVINIPFAFLGGVAGKFFGALSITMVFALSLSFLFSVLCAPLVATLVLRQKDADKEARRQQRSSHRMADSYEHLLRRLMRWKLVAPVFLFALLIAAGALYRQVGTGFMPDMDEGTFVLDYWTPPGTSLEETDRMLLQVEGILRSTPEVENYGRRTGAELGFFVTEPNSGDILVKLRKQRRRSIFEVIDEIRSRIALSQPAMQVEFGQQMQDVIGDLTNNPSPIEIRVFGDQPEQLQGVARNVADIITPIRGVEDVFDGITVSGPNLAIHVDPEKAALAGMRVSDVRDQLESYMTGRAETHIRRGERLVGVRTRSGPAYRTDMNAIRKLQLHSPDGYLVPLQRIATLAPTTGQAEIERENSKPMVAVTARISGRDLGSTVSEIRSTLRQQLQLPPGVTLAYGGTYQTQQESFRGLLAVFGAAALLVFIVLLFEFESFRVPLSVFAVNVPALFGVVLALRLTGMTFNVSSFVGTILIVGIVAENAIFLLHTATRLHEQGLGMEEALVQASRVRARPILMTTFAAILALMPLALGTGSGSQIQQPLAIAVIGGFSVSTFLLLFALPLVFALFHSRGGRGTAVSGLSSPIDVEPRS